MKVAWLSTFPPQSTGEKVFLRPHLNALKEIGVDVDLINLGDLYSPSRLIAARHRFLKSKTRYDLCHSQWGSGCGLLTATLPGKKILTLRGNDWYFPSKMLFGLGLRGVIGPVLSRLILTKFHEVIVVSERMRSDVQPYLRKAIINVLPTPIDLRNFPLFSLDEARVKLGFEGDATKWILFSSAENSKDSVVKRPDLARAAVNYCKLKFPTAKFISISGVPREVIPLWFCAANVLLVTSVQEGWPNVVKEALACNRPFVSTDVSDLRAIASKSSTCKVVDGNAEALGQALIDTLVTQGHEDLRAFVSDMSPEKSAVRVKEIYTRVLNER